MKKVILITWFLLLVSSTALAVTFPEPQKYMVDTTGILGYEDITRINSLCNDIEKNTTSEIAVVLIGTTGDMTIEEYAVRLFEEWGIGKKGKDNGLLVLVAKDDRKWRIEVGYGLEGVVNDAKAGEIGRKYMTSSFMENRYGDGLFDTVYALGQAIKGEYVPEEDMTAAAGAMIAATIFGFSAFILVIVLFVMLILMMVKAKKSKKMMLLNEILSLGFAVLLIALIIGSVLIGFADNPLFWVIILILVILIIIIIIRAFKSLGKYKHGRGWVAGGGWGSGGGGFGGGSSGGGGASGGW